MTDQVWICDVMVNNKSVYHFSPPQEERMKNLDSRSRLVSAYAKAEEIDFQLLGLPEVRLQMVVNPIKRLPDIIRNDVAMVSERVFNLFAEFDLGSTRLQRVTLLPYQKSKPAFEPDYFYLNITETKSAVVYEKCKDIQPGSRYYVYYGGFSSIAVDLSQAKGVDLWIEPLLRGAIFLSDRLYQAIKDEGLDYRVGFHKCHSA